MEEKIKKLLFSLFLCLVCISILGQPEHYTLANVPEAIKKNAAVVTLFENINVEVESLDKMNIKTHKIFSVLNEDGKMDLPFHQYSSKFVSLDEAEVRVFDANGKQIEKYKKKDMRMSAVGEGLVEDGYVTYLPISTNSYPVTVEFKYEQTVKSTLTIPDYRFIHSKEGIVESNYTVRTSPDLPVRYKNFNTSIQPIISEEGKYKIYKWSVKDVAPIEYEEGAVSARSKYPHVSIVMDNFSHYGFHGDLSSWKNFGLWISALYEGLDALPADRQQFFLQLVKDASGETEKAKRIYNYLQKNFRYVSIQLGIGGLRPFSAEFTDQKKYGDCKALSNYMKAALKSVGVKSYVAIVNSEYNEEPVDPGFPSNDFDHVILCVPGQKDSVWLECTSSATEFGELGTFTENKNALLITEAGGVLVATPKSHSYENIFSTVTSVSIADDLSGEIETVFATKGAYREILNDILKEKKDEQKKDIVFYFGSKQPDEFVFAKDEFSGTNKAKLKMTIAKIPEFSAGSKLFISPRAYKLWSTKLPKSENRKLDFYFRYPFEKYDTTILKLPAGMSPDVLPKEKELKCEYASYKSKYWSNEPGNAIYCATSFILKQHKIPATDYVTVKKFFDDLMQEDLQRIVVKKAETEKKAF